jgi:lysophospholipid acyltransferase 1/2
MTYQSVLHLNGQIYDYGNFTLDITTMIMITTQKLTTLAFAYYDGMRASESLSKDQKEQVVNQLPNALEFFSYIFNFQSILAGPLCTYNDYMDFIKGTDVTKHQNPKALENEKVIQPSNTKVLLEKITYVIGLSVFFQMYFSRFPIEANISDEMVNASILYRLFYCYVSVLLLKTRLYIVWILSDAVNNASGLGFNGFTEDGTAKWDLVTNISPHGVESSTSFKTFVDKWNILTTIWLRRIAYDRLPSGKTLGVFVLSAFWHGWYPGFYLSFVSGALLVYSGRGIRRKIRPLFQKNKFTIILYAILTWLATMIATSLTIVPYFLLQFWLGLKFYSSCFFCVQIICILSIVLLPVASTKKPKQTKEN